MMSFAFISMLFPIVAGIVVLITGKKSNRTVKLSCVITTICVSALCIIATALTRKNTVTELIRFSSALSISFKTDSLSLVFASVTNVIWLPVAIYSTGYMKHEENEDIFYGFMLITLGILNALYFADNLLTLYLFFELATLASMPMVLSSRTKEAIAAAQKYLFYSIGGAFLALFGVVLIYSMSREPSFAGNVVHLEANELTLTATMLMIFGFGTKSGLYPMHGWLPTAHPVAPSPASALLSGLIAEAGVFAVIRVVKYSPAPRIDGTWVQYVWLSFAMITVLLGSMMAYRETHIKKRLAYSTVSQISYIMVGVAYGGSMAFYGAILHYIFHAVIKTALFMSAGSIIMKTGKTDVNELEGIGKDMPVTMWGYTLASLGLIGIPPACGFFSKYYLCVGAFKVMEETGMHFLVLSWLVPTVLIISALLTAGYLLPITVRGFFPNKDYIPVKRETGPVMYAPILILGILTITIGLFMHA